MARTFLEDYDWKIIQNSYDSGSSYRGLSKQFGMTHSTISRAAKRGLFAPRSVSEGTRLFCANNEREFTEQRRETMSGHAKRRGLGGTRNSNKFQYQCVDGSIVKLDSSYEVTVATDLDANGISWCRPQRFDWIDAEGIHHKYRPDFYLVDFDVYLDPKHKGLIPLHLDKIQRVIDQNGIRLYILKIEQLSWEAIKLVMGP